MPSRRPFTPSERATLYPFVVATGTAAPRDQRDLMERPFFSLAKAKRITPILYEAGDVRVEVHAVPDRELPGKVRAEAAERLLALVDDGDLPPFPRECERDAGADAAAADHEHLHRAKP